MAAARAGVTEELAPGRNWSVSIGRKQLPEDLLESTWRCRTAADRCCQLTQRPLQLSAGASLLTPFQSPGLAAGLRGGRVKSLAESSSRRPESDYGVFTTATKITRGPENPEGPKDPLCASTQSVAATFTHYPAHCSPSSSRSWPPVLFSSL